MHHQIEKRMNHLTLETRMEAEGWVPRDGTVEVLGDGEQGEGIDD